MDFINRARHAVHDRRQPDAAHNAPQDDSRDYQDRRVSEYPVHEIDPSAALSSYRLLVGINQDKSFAAPKGWMHNRKSADASILARPASNLGLYTTVCESEIKSKRNYKSFARLINSALGLQIIVAAALTALGAANGSRSAVTVFGAINTIIAGFLTYLKGSGLPNRFKYFQHEWQKVREYIEQRERDFTLNMPGLDVNDEVDKIRTMYELVKADIATNTPERFVSVTQIRAQAQAGVSPAPRLARPQDSFSTDSLQRRYLSEKEPDLTAAAKSSMFARFGQIKEVLEDRAKEVGQMEKDVETHGRQAVEEKKEGMMGQIQSTIKELAHLGKEIQATASAATAQAEQRGRDAEVAMGQAADAAKGAVAQRTQDVQAARNGVLEQVAQRQHDAEQGRDALAAQVSQRVHATDAAIAQSSNAARDAIKAQQNIVHAALHGNSESIPPK